MLKIITLVYLSSLALAAPRPVPLTEGTVQQLKDARLLFNFQGKGSSLAYDAGVVDEAFRNIPALSEGKVVLSANSGGAIMAAYFSCWGFSDHTVAEAKRILVQGTPQIKKSVEELRATAENVKAKIDALVDGVIPAIPIHKLDPYIAALLGIDDIKDLPKSKCVPKLPFVIAAANIEVLHTIAPDFKMDLGWLERYLPSTYEKTLAIKSLDEKVLDYKTFSVSWKPKTHADFQKAVSTPEGLAKFRATHANINVGPTPYIGKACTYFASPEMYALLSAIPPTERLCDVRLTDDAAGIAMAIRASAAEPTYFPFVPEAEPTKLLVGDLPPTHDAPVNLGNSVERHYWGGMVMPMVAQDIRRSLPHLRVLGTGWTRISDGQSSILQALTLVDSGSVAKYSEYWADVAIVPSKASQNAISNSKLNPEIEFQDGLKRTAECFQKERDGKPFCLPEGLSLPAFRTAAPEAIIVDPADKTAKSLKVRRGLGELLVR